MRTYTNKRTYRDLNMPNTTTSCFKTPFKPVETKQQPAAKVRQAPQVTVTKVAKKLSLLQRIKNFFKL